MNTIFIKTSELRLTMYNKIGNKQASKEKKFSHEGFP